MIIYIFLWVLIIVLGIVFYYDKTDIKFKSNLFLGFSFLFLFLVSALRGINVGVDTLAYHNIFNTVKYMSVTEILESVDVLGFESGYGLLNKLVSFFFNNSQWMIAINSLIFTMGMAFFIKNNSSNYFLSTFIFLSEGVYFLSFNLSRQMIAVMFICNSWYFLKRRKYLPYFIFIFIAFLFHQTSLVFLISFLLEKLPTRKNIYFILISISMLLMLFYSQLIEFLIIIIPRFSKYLANTGFIISAGGITYLWILEVVMCIFCIFFIKWSNEREKKDVYNFSIFVIFYIILSVIGLRFNYVDRVGIYFRPFLIILIPKFLFKLKTEGVLIRVFAYVLLAFFFFTTIINSEQLTYHFFWN